MKTKFDLRTVLLAYHEKLQAKDTTKKVMIVSELWNVILSIIVFILALLFNSYWYNAVGVSVMTFMMTFFTLHLTIAGEGVTWCPVWYYKIFRMSPLTTFIMGIMLYVLVSIMLYPTKHDDILLRILWGFNIIWYVATTLYLLLITPLNQHFPKKDEPN